MLLLPQALLISHNIVTYTHVSLLVTLNAYTTTTTQCRLTTTHRNLLPAQRVVAALVPPVQPVDAGAPTTPHATTSTTTSPHLLPEDGVHQAYYHHIRGLKQSLVAVKTLQKTEIQETI